MAIRAEGLVGGVVLLGILLLIGYSMRSPASTTEEQPPDPQLQALFTRVGGLYRLENVSVGCDADTGHSEDYVPAQLILRPVRTRDGVVLHETPCEGSDCGSRARSPTTSFPSHPFAIDPAPALDIPTLANHVSQQLRRRKMDTVELTSTGDAFTRTETIRGAMSAGPTEIRPIACYQLTTEERVEPDGNRQYRLTRRVQMVLQQCDRYSLPVADAGVPICLQRVTGILRAQPTPPPPPPQQPQRR